ncbi:unannotated protein [freshwater metagenome]|uniref:Unannotated protein n=1 Tax=freshwater metagenome TaxID=449393 RepID=A0A6J7DGJ3_9ZZZZ|nr:alpha/beta fold hydrolase [Actinomycetota bacterium]
MATLEVGTATVGYAVEGAGTPVLLFHGTTMARTCWDMVRGAMPANTYQFVLFEFPGSGESSQPASPLTVEGIVEQALALMDHLGHDRFHVGGYSLGAVTALATAAAAPGRVLSVTSLCGWAAADARQRVTFELWKRLIQTDPELFMRYAMADGFTASALSMLEPMLDAMIAMGAGTIAPGSAAQLDLDMSLDISAMLAAICVPALIIGATEDRWVDISHSRSLAENITGSRLVELPAGHLVIQELAADVATLLHAHIGAV